jgi:hypothetical protein
MAINKGDEPVPTRMLVDVCYHDPKPEYPHARKPAAQPAAQPVPQPAARVNLEGGITLPALAGVIPLRKDLPQECKGISAEFSYKGRKPYDYKYAVRFYSEELDRTFVMFSDRPTFTKALKHHNDAINIVKYDRNFGSYTHHFVNY